MTLRDQIGELCRSLALTVLFAGVATVLWAALAHAHLGNSHDLNFLGAVFFLIVGVSWSILVPSKFWTDRRGDSWTRRLVMLVVGGLVGAGALWLNGWSPGQVPVSLTPDRPGYALASLVPSGVLSEASFISYFAVAFFALRWWRLTDRRRPQRFSFAPVLAAGFWGLVLLLLAGPQLWYGVGVLTLASVVVQLVSPWEPPPPPSPRKMRLRYA